MISELGFFSSDALKDELQIATDYPDLFGLSEKLARLFLGLMRSAELDPACERNLAVNALAARSLEFFQGTIIQLRRGSAPTAKVLCRSAIETVYKLSAILLAPNGMELYIAQEPKSRLLKLKGVQAYRKAHGELPPLAHVDAEVDLLKQLKPRKTESSAWATLAKMDDFHSLYFQWVSDDTHASIESLNHYFDDASPYLISFGPTDKEISVVAAIAHRTLLVALERYAAFQGTSIELTGYRAETDAIEKKYA